MSKRASISLLILLTLLAAAAGAAYWFRDSLPDLFPDPVYTDEIPAERPRRPDRRILARFVGLPANRVVEILKKERTAQPPGPGTAPRVSPPPPLLAMLPEAPLPFPADAVPRDEAGLKAVVASRQGRGVEAFASSLERREYNLALAALGVKAESIPAEIRLETRPAPESDTFPVRLLRRETGLRGPLAAGDFDGVEGLELVAAGGAELHRLATGGNTVPLDGLAGTEPGISLHPADFDGDGDLDLYVARGEGLPDSLLRNGGQGNFSDETAALGLLAFGDTTAVVWLDYDRDGHLDLLVGYRDRPLELFRQTGGNFEPVAWDLKLWVPRGISAAAAADVDGDGFPDLLLAREDGRGRLLLSRQAPNPAEWRFEEKENEFGFAAGSAVTALAFGDVDHDGRPDLFLATATPDPEAGSLRLLHNAGGGDFVDATEAAGLKREEPILSLGLADLDGDGYDDLLLGTEALFPDRAFANQGGTGFREVTVVSGTAYLDDNAAWLPITAAETGSPVLLSVRRDGRVRWLEAEGASPHWLRVAVPGQPAGLRLTAIARDRDWVVHAYPRQLGSDGVVNFALAEGEVVERLEVHAPGSDAPLEVIDKPELNRLHVLNLSRPGEANATNAAPLPEGTDRADAP